METMWYKGTVKKGNQLGRTINFPTINLDPSIISYEMKEGVYAALVKHTNEVYKGALYFGPRLVLNETKKVLEIFILDFHKEIYGECVEFQIKKFIRGIQNFDSFEELKTQLQKDIKEIELLNL